MGGCTGPGFADRAVWIAPSGRQRPVVGAEIGAARDALLIQVEGSYSRVRARGSWGARTLGKGLVATFMVQQSRYIRSLQGQLEGMDLYYY